MIASDFIEFTTRLLEGERFGEKTSDSLFAALLEESYGREDLLSTKLEALQRQCAQFMEAYGDGPVFVMRAPARINLLGEHVDYVSYLPTASLTFGSREHEMILFFRPSENGRVRGISTLPGCDPLSFDLADAPPGSGMHGNAHEWTHYLYMRSTPAAHWGNYARGAIFFARMKHGERIRRGLDFLVSSSIPSAGGASSSSALTVLVGAAIRRANGLSCDARELALDSGQAEWYVGTRGGTMDHLTICLSRQQHLVHIAYNKDQPVLLPMGQTQYRLVTFYAHPADKSREVMLEYNERAAVARILIPALIEDWAVSRPLLHSSWHAALAAAQEQSTAGQGLLAELLSNLPESISLREVENRFPAAFGSCAEAFDALVRDRLERPLKVRDRALHHLGEVRRVAEAARVLQSISDAGLLEEAEPHTPGDKRRQSGPVRRPGSTSAEMIDEGMRRIGELLNESHRSLRDLYEVSTPVVERLISAVVSDSLVYGARLMGGGFGGNVLALTRVEHAPALVAHMQALFFSPGGRDGARQNAVMISTPGDGLAAFDAESAARRAVERFNEDWRAADRGRAGMRSILAQIVPQLAAPDIWPVILAAGKGERARKSGLHAPKPLTPVLGIPAVLRVLRAVQSACSSAFPPIVIVSPETEQPMREALAGEEVTFVLQPQALGTGDAIFGARDQLRDYRGRTLVVWGTQPVIRPETVRLAIGLAALFPDFEMVLPTTVMERPYAPLYRDARSQVEAAHETHLEHMRVPEFGETNIGLFLLWNEPMLAELKRLRNEFWRESAQRYARPRGELGFPNEMIRSLAGRQSGVLACPIADWREEKGIKNKADVARCEQYLRELSAPE